MESRAVHCFYFWAVGKDGEEDDEVLGLDPDEDGGMEMTLNDAFQASRGWDGGGSGQPYHFKQPLF